MGNKNMKFVVRIKQNKLCNLKYSTIICISENLNTFICWLFLDYNEIIMVNFINYMGRAPVTRNYHDPPPPLIKIISFGMVAQNKIDFSVFFFRS